MSEPYLGEIRSFAFSRVPRAWAECAGQSLPVSGNQALYGLIGNHYGGDAVNFNLPDLRGRIPVGRGRLYYQEAHEYGGDYSEGQIGGLETVTLSAAELPKHKHEWVATAANGTTQVLAGNFLANARYIGGSMPIYAAPDGANKVTLAGDTIGSSSGGRGPHQNMQPWLATGYFICTTGIMPTP